MKEDVGMDGVRSAKPIRGWGWTTVLVAVLSGIGAVAAGATDIWMPGTPRLLHKAPVCTENLIRVDDVVKSLKLAE
jgi:hypothetical protein